ncbi:class I SAM-dependent methyltransferase [Patescibacteria group bacterium]|nr:class I SAM-dependent methyltransferase [Patescibacteria group bacterium]
MKRFKIPDFIRKRRVTLPFRKIKGIISENYNSKVLTEIWGDYIDWGKRRKGENGWLVNQLKKYNCHKVFESSFGDGCDAIFLQKEGFDVTANEIDKVFLKKGLQNTQREGVELKVTKLDWRELDKEIEKESFDAVLSLGNSLTYLFIQSDQITVLKQFRSILRPGGILIIDERNYQYILDNRKEILKGNFYYSGKYVYCGEKVHGRPIEITDEYVKFQYTEEATGKKGYLILYPFRRDEMQKLLTKAGFSKIEQYSDYQPGYNPEADFFMYVCQK